MTRVRNLVLVLGDQLDGASAAFDGFEPERDAVLQIEAREEATYVPQHKKRLAFFFSAMRHFHEAQRGAGRRAHYSRLDDPANAGTLWDELARRASELGPKRIIVLEPGDWRVRERLAALDLAIEFRADRHFLCSTEAFAAFADENPRLLLETFYRRMRVKLGVLIEPDGTPTGGDWNFDKDNRAAFSQSRRPLVEREFADSPGRLDAFDLPVTRADALACLADFVERRLPLFGRYEDAMAVGEPFLFHSHLSGLLNLHLLRPAEVLEAVLANPGDAPINSVEGFVRQLIGWREFVRGIYWRFMPEYAHRNALGAELAVPAFYWTGETDMRCLSQCIGHTLDHAYAHHIERLMVLGEFCLLLGVQPYEVHRWHMSMFWDAIDWVSLPNALGMSQHGDGGLFATKPYAASGNYIDRMSNYCRACRYDPKRSVGDDACPFTTLYWDFLARDEPRLADNPRMRYPYLNLARKDAKEMAAIRQRADQIRARVLSGRLI